MDSNTDSLGYTAIEQLISNEHNKQYDLGLIPNFDLALIIKRAEGQDLEVNQKDTVCLETVVINQGKADAYNIELVNYVPEGMIYSIDLNNHYNTGWRPDSTYRIDSLLAGDTVRIPIKFTINMDLMDSLVLDTAEITFATRTDDGTENAEDIDSEADDVNDDIIGRDDETENYRDDEDDHDYVHLVDLQDVDPIGYLFAGKTGKIINISNVGCINSS